MTFEHLPIGGLPKVELEEVDDKHYYLCDGNMYPSVTTILAATSHSDGLKHWRLKVGEDVADHIASSAAAVGTEAHRFNEYYLNNREPDWERSESTLYGLAHHNNMRPYLDKISTVYGTEVKLVSHKHRFAGTVDCVGMYNGKMSVLDYKCKKKPQEKRWVYGYFLQVAAYREAWNEMTGMNVEQGVILASNRHGTMQEYVIDTKAYTADFFKRLQEYHGDHRQKRIGIKVP